MHPLELVFLALAIAATYYQLLKLAMYHALLTYRGRIDVNWRFYASLAFSIFLQVLFVASMTGIVGIEK